LHIFVTVIRIVCCQRH